MEVGERFSPFELFNGIYIPQSLVLLPVKQLSQGAKITYGRLCRYSGENGKAYPKRETLGYEVGCSVRQVDNYIKELVTSEFLEVDRIGLNRNNEYHFIWHPILEASLRRPFAGIAKNSHSNILSFSYTELKDEATPSIKESHCKRIIKGDKTSKTAKASLAVPSELDKLSNDINEIHKLYRKLISERAWLTAPARKSISDRLKEFDAETLILAIENFSENKWYMKRHRFRRLEWFFKDSDQIYKWLGLPDWDIPEEDEECEEEDEGDMVDT